LKQKVLVLGAGGQLGRELQRTVPAGVECVPRTRAELDIADASAVAECLADVQPGLVVNAAAYTAVDKAESEKAEAHRGNAEAPGVVAAACAQRGVRFIHISTDFVFDGRASEPYRPEAATAPLGEYGRSKLEGEVAVQGALPEALILRTGWVYSSFGGNFVKTMLRLMGAAARPQLQGIYHWSDAGVCSWYDFAVAICEEALALNLLSKPVKVRPIAAAEYPTPAQRPAYSVLDKTSSWRDFAMEGVHWRRQLRAMLADFKELADA
jgi:dTDP-4-dehydrorhamnose reductase